MTVKHAFSALTTEWDSLKDTHTYVKWLLCAESLVALYTEIVWREQIKNKKQKQWLNVNDNQQYWRRCGDMHLTFEHLLLHCIRQISRLIEWLQITITEKIWNYNKKCLPGTRWAIGRSAVNIHGLGPLAMQTNLWAPSSELSLAMSASRCWPPVDSFSNCLIENCPGSLLGLKEEGKKGQCEINWSNIFENHLFNCCFESIHFLEL